ncbi:MoaD/ThiS family protein [Corynebacterium gerontici]|nr:MoaD/ThiS family protein [Corynebacterium gerontici]
MEIHYFAAAKAARGVGVEHLEFGGTLEQLIEHLAAQSSLSTDSGLSLADVFERCTFLVDGANADQGVDVSQAERVDVLPPFAGG